MPELPEVETIARDLRPLLCGRTIIAVKCGRKRLRVAWQGAWDSQVTGRRLDSVRRRGKWLIFGLGDGSALLGHLGMTGQMTVAAATQPKETHTHLVFTLDNGCEWRYRDVRRFGGMRRCVCMADVEAEIAERLGPEPWDLDPIAWHDALSRSRRCLKAILLDQSVVAGVGNIYADEALFGARLGPRQSGAETTRAQAERLRVAIIEVLERAIAGRGSTIRDYIGGSGLRGQFQEQLNVYGRTKQPCPNCRRLIQCIRLAGRSSHYCPGCQKSPQRRRPAKR